MHPCKEKLKNRATYPATTLVTTNTQIALYVNYGNSLKIKNEKNHLIGMVRMTEPLFNTLPPFSNSMRCFKKSGDHHFCDNLKTVILSFDPCIDY